MVVSSDCMKNATATSQGSIRLMASSGLAGGVVVMPGTVAMHIWLFNRN
jgi:hypothetical protein